MKMKKFKAVLAYVMAVAVGVTSLPGQVFATGIGEVAADVDIKNATVTDNELDMWYDAPATDWETQALPIGNGYAGAQIFGGVKKEQFSLNDKTLWKGGPGIEKTTQWDYTYGNWSPARPGNLQNARDQIEANTYVNTGTIQQLLATQNNSQFLAMYGSYQPLGDLFIEMNHSDTGATNYLRGLDLDNGLSLVKYTMNGVNYTRESFFSYPANAMVTKITADKAGAITFDMSMTTKLTGNRGFTAENGKLTFRGTLPDNGMIYESQAQVVNEGGTVTSQDGIVSVAGANSVTIYYSSGTNYKFKYDDDITKSYRGEDPHAAITTRVADSVTKGYDSLKAAHMADHNKLYGRVKLDLGQQRPTTVTNTVLTKYKNNTATDTEKRYVEELAFNYGRYLLIASSRAGSLPANLQGVWSPLMNPAWQSDYHVNINLEMNYWGADVTNLGETLVPFNDFMESMYEPGKITAKRLFESAGWTINNPINAFGYTGVQNYANGFWFPESTSWLLRSSYDHYLFTKDTAYLEKIYPLIKGQADFWMSYLIKDQRDGTWVASPSLLPEQAPFAAGTSMAQQISNDIFQNFVDVSTFLNKDTATRDAVIEKMNTLDKGLRVGKFGYVSSWKDDKNTMNPDAATSNFRHLNQAYALYPGDDISYEDTPELMAAERKMLESRASSSQGWSRVWRTMLWARVKDSKQAYDAYNQLLAKMTNANFFMMHPPFQIDANLGTPGAVAEMLLQSHLGYVDPIPALPTEWKDGSFKGLVARGNFVMDMAWKDSLITSMKAVSNVGGNLDIMYDLDGATVKVGNTTLNPTRTNNGAYRIPTNKGDIVTITMGTAKKLTSPMNTSAIRTAADKVVVKWDAVEGATKYKVYKFNTATKKLAQLTTEPTTNTIIDTTSDNGYYRVTAVNAAGESRLGITAGVDLTVAPSNVKAVRTNGTDVTLTWDALKDATSYNVYRQQADGSISKIASPTATTYVDKTGDNLVYYVTGVSKEMEVDYTRTNGTGQVTLKWNAVDGVTKYHIINTDQTVNEKDLGEVTGTQYIHTGITDAVNRNGYYIRAIMPTATESGFSTMAVVQLPKAPKYPLAVRSNPNSIKITWDAATGAAKYNVYKMNDAGVGEKVGTVNATAGSEKEMYNHATTTDGIYRVTLVDANGIESYMSVNAVVQLTGTPEKVKAVRSSASQVTITWGSVTDAAKYYVLERGADGTTYTKIANSDTTTATFVHNTTANGAYRIVAVAASGVESEPSLVTAVSTVVESITVNPSSKQLNIGESVTLTATVTPADATNGTVSWTSSNQTVATVSNGVVKAVSGGNATITATAGGKNATCAITVIADPNAPIDLTRSLGTSVKVSLGAGEVSGETSETVGGVVYPMNDPQLVLMDMTTENTSNAYKRFATAVVQKGTNNIGKTSSVIIDLGQSAEIASTFIKFYSFASPSKYDVSVSTDKNTWKLLKAEDKSALAGTEAREDTLTVEPKENARYVKYTFKEQDANKGPGYIRIKYIAIYGKTTGTNPPQETPVASVTMNKSTSSIQVGSSETFTARVLPDNATNKQLVWDSSDKTVATVTNAGVVSALKAGTTKITATASNGVKGEATITVTPAPVVPVNVTSIEMKASTSLEEGATEVLAAKVLPENATNKVLTWSSNDTAVATVTNGTITAVKEGRATITATANNGVKAEIQVTVTAKQGTNDDRQELTTTLASAKEYQEDKYTPDSFNILKEKIKAAEELLAQANPDNKDVFNALAELKDAINGLVIKPTPPTLKNGWYVEDGKNRYYVNDLPKANTWVEAGKDWKYTDKDGYQATKWISSGGYWYYLNPTTGIMKTGWLKDGASWYFLQSSGKMKTGWLKDGGAWYFLQSSGKMKIGWQKDGGAWYFLQSSGKMKTGWVKDGGVWYFLQSSGKMKTGWLKDGASWYFLQSSGKMKTGWLKDNGSWYYLQSSGKMKTGWLKDGASWYYLQSSGKMKTGWLNVGGAWYYLYSSGKMATGWVTVGAKPYYLNPTTGVWQA